MDFLVKLNRKDLENMFSHLLEDVKELDSDLACKYTSELEEYMYCISKDEAIKIVSNMKPYRRKILLRYYFSNHIF